MKKLNKIAAITAAVIMTLTNTTAIFAETIGAAETAYVQTEQTQELTVETAREEILQSVNKERAAAGLAPLTLDNDLSYAAQLKAQDIAETGKCEHESAKYGEHGPMLQSLGITYNCSSENLAYGWKTSEIVMREWMNSDVHRKHIMDGRYGKLGVGYAIGNGTVYWVQIFTD